MIKNIFKNIANQINKFNATTNTNKKILSEDEVNDLLDIPIENKKLENKGNSDLLEKNEQTNKTQIKKSTKPKKTRMHKNKRKNNITPEIE